MLVVAKDALNKGVFAHVVSQKDVDPTHYSVDALVKDIAWLGYRRLSLRSDNEPAILQLLRHALTEARLQIEQLEQLVEEHPNTYDSAANGEVEAKVKQITGILRTNKLDFEKRIEREIPFDHPIMTWLAEYAACMINIRVVGANGAVAFERIRRRPFHKRLLPFGELVHVHLPLDGPAQARCGALEARRNGWLRRHLALVFRLAAIPAAGSPYAVHHSASAFSAVERAGAGGHNSYEDGPAWRLWRACRSVCPPTARCSRTRGRARAGPARCEALRVPSERFRPRHGGHGWTEHGPKCDRARLYGWRSAIQMQHSDACRTRIELALEHTQRGRERLEHAKLRFDRRRAALAALPDDAQLEPAGRKHSHKFSAAS